MLLLYAPARMCYDLSMLLNLLGIPKYYNKLTLKTVHQCPITCIIKLHTVVIPARN